MSLPCPRAEPGATAVMAVGEAASCLPLPAADAEAWLRSIGVVRRIGLGRATAEVVIWGDVVEAIRASVHHQLPLRTWREVAEACGVSEDTVARRRAAAGDDHEAWFEDGDAARAWYRALIAAAKAPPKPRPRKAKSRKPPAAPRTGTVDWNAVARGTSGRR